MLIDLRECHTACQKCFNKNRKRHDIRDFLLAQCWKSPEVFGTSKAQNLGFSIRFVGQKKTDEGAEKDRRRGLLVSVMNHQKVKSHV